MAKIIDINDIGTGSSYRLDGSDLEMIVAGGCSDALNDNGCVVDESMPDGEIKRRVYASWVKGYEGDPEENELRITVSPEEWRDED